MRRIIYTVQFLILPVILLLASTASNALEITLVTGPVFSRFQESPNYSGFTYRPRMGLSFGALFNMRVYDSLSLEPGLLFLLRRTSQDDPSITANDPNANPTLLSSFRTIQIPLTLRYQFAQFLSLGTGGYLAQGFSRIQSRSSRSSTTGEAGYDERFINKFDYGVVDSLRLGVPLAPELLLVLDTRYNVGLKDVNTSPSFGPKYWREVQFLIGLTVGAQTNNEPDYQTIEQ